MFSKRGIRCFGVCSKKTDTIPAQKSAVGFGEITGEITREVTRETKQENIRTYHTVQYSTAGLVSLFRQLSDKQSR